MRVDVEISLSLEMPDAEAVEAAIAGLYDLLTDGATDALVGEPAADLAWTLRRLLARLPQVDEVIEHHVTVGYEGDETQVSGGRRPRGPGRGPGGGNPPDEGGSGVREPRRPRPTPPGSLAAELPVEPAI